MYTFTVLTYGAILTSILSLSSTAVDVLFMRENRQGKLELEIGRASSVQEGSLKSYITSVLLVGLLVVCPKIVFYSWTMAMFRWQSGVFFVAVVSTITLIKYICTKDHLHSRENGKRYGKRLRDSMVSAFMGTFGVETSQITSAIVLCLCSLFAIALLVLGIPHEKNEASWKYDEISSLNLYQISRKDDAQLCICHNMTDVLNSWQKQYFKNGIVCWMENDASQEIDRTGLSNSTARCYEKIFFKSPKAFSVIPISLFPAAGMCITFDGIINDLTGFKTNLSSTFRFDDTCNVKIEEMFLPCSNELLFGTKVLLSVMIIWMGFSLFAVAMVQRIKTLKHPTPAVVVSRLIITFVVAIVCYLLVDLGY